MITTARICAALLVSLLLPACMEEPPADPGITLLGTQASRDDAGNVHLSTVLLNGGSSGSTAFTGTYCVSAKWMTGGTVSYEDQNRTLKGGTEVAEGQTCASNLGTGAGTHVDVISSVPVTDADVLILISLDLQSTDHDPTTNVITSPPPP